MALNKLEDIKVLQLEKKISFQATLTSKILKFVFLQNRSKN